MRSWRTVAWMRSLRLRHHHRLYTPSLGYDTTNFNAKYTINIRNIRKALDKKIEAADENPCLY